MTKNDQELEVKFYISDLPRLERRLQELGAELDSARVQEVNLRFDTAEGDLERASQVLRLRLDREARLTFKGPSQNQEGARLRTEIEFVVSSFDSARALLKALGYQVSMMYEKRRTTYRLDGVEVTLDEMPYGNFAEIEGPDSASIQAVNQRTGLDWERRVPVSYTSLFDQLRTRLGLSFRDLSFANFRDLTITPQDLGVQPADE